MASIFHLTINDDGFLLTLFKLIGFGITYHKDKKEHSISFSFKLWKLNTFVTFALI